jgi:PAP2 superfamily protein
MPDLPDLQTIALRLLAVGLALAAWFVTQRMIAARSAVGGAPYDHLHVVTARWNAWLHRHPGAANAILVASSLGVDVLTLFVLGYAVLGPSFMPFWGLLALFALRQLSQALVALPAPADVIWRHPGFPSLFVTYHVGNDFFFSGHTALAVYGAIQVASLNIPALTLLATVIATLEAIVVIVLRAHWSMDVLAGLFAALGIGLLVWQG